jgi:hypothetical protein
MLIKIPKKFMSSRKFKPMNAEKEKMNAIVASLYYERFQLGFIRARMECY